MSMNIKVRKAYLDGIKKWAKLAYKSKLFTDALFVCSLCSEYGEGNTCSTCPLHIKEAINGEMDSFCCGGLFIKYESSRDKEIAKAIHILIIHKYKQAKTVEIDSALGIGVNYGTDDTEGYS